MKISAFQIFRGKTKSFDAEINWQDFAKVEDPEMITLRVVPDRTVDNKQNFKMMRALHELYQAPLARVGFGHWFIKYTPKAHVWYDAVLTKDEIKFYFTVPRKWETYAKQKIIGCWPRASVDRADDGELTIPLDNTKVSELVYKRHNIFALHLDRAEDTQPLGAVMSACRDMGEGDIARLSICADPNHRLNWQDQAEQAHKQFSQGKTPQRRSLSKRKALLSTGTLLEGIFQQIGDLFLSILGHNDDNAPKVKQIDQDKREILIEGSLQRSTTSKRNEPTFSTRIRVASHSANDNRREITSRALSNSFVDVAGDNELESVEVGHKATVRILCEINRHRLKLGSLLEMDTNIMSASELGKLAQIPGPGLQDIYADQLDTIKQRQDGPPASVTGNGMLLGYVQLKKEKVEVSMPVNNPEETCLPTAVTGGMGCGKTSEAVNTALEAQKKGYGFVTFDPAKREIGQEIMLALKPEEYIHVDLSKRKINLDWVESNHSKNSPTRLANTILAFFDMQGTEMQTERFLFAAIIGMKTRKLGEILKIFEDDDYRDEVIDGMKDGINKSTLIEFGGQKMKVMVKGKEEVKRVGGYSPDRQRAILAPVYNRLSILLRDDYLNECMNCDDDEYGLNFVELMEQNKCVIIDIPDDTFDKAAKDILINILMVKIDLAMRLRDKNATPFFVICDEPHQYLRSERLWTSSAVESRKYRVAFVWLFHSWEQIPDALQEIIISAGPHFFIYRSSAKTYQSLKHYILPFSLEEVTKMPLFSSIAVIRAELETTRPFMIQMTPPPSKQKALKNAAK